MLCLLLSYLSTKSTRSWSSETQFNKSVYESRVLSQCEEEATFQLREGFPFLFSFPSFVFIVFSPSPQRQVTLKVLPVLIKATRWPRIRDSRWRVNQVISCEGGESASSGQTYPELRAVGRPLHTYLGSQGRLSLGLAGALVFFTAVILQPLAPRRHVQLMK